MFRNRCQNLKRSRACNQREKSSLLQEENNAQQEEIEIQSILIIHYFCIFKFTFSLKFISNTKIINCVTFALIYKHTKQQIWVAWCTLSQLKSSKKIVFLFLHWYNICVLLAVCLVPCFSHFCTSFPLISLF